MEPGALVAAVAGFSDAFSARNPFRKRRRSAELHNLAATSLFLNIPNRQ
jgi:hypothetical protein